MNWNSIHSKRKATAKAVLLCLIFSFQVLNMATYSHTHLLANGTVVSHAHPYSKSTDSEPFKKHHHTDSQFALLTQLNLLFLVAILIFAHYGHFTRQLPTKWHIQLYRPGFLSRKPGRSPPLLS